MKKKARKPVDDFRATPRGVPPDVKEALDVVGEIERVIEEDVDDRAKSRGGDFFEGVLDKAKSIGATVEKNNRVSPNQRGALDNMLAAVRKWVHDDDDD